MGQSNFIRDQKLYTGTAANSGGTFTADYTLPANMVSRVRAWVFLSHATTGAIDAAASLCAECVVENLGAGAAFPTARGLGQVNPNNSNSTDVTGLVGDTGVQASDAAFVNAGGGVNPTAVFTAPGGSVLRLTVTNNSTTSVAANVTVMLEVMSVGST